MYSEQFIVIQRISGSFKVIRSFVEFYKGAVQGEDYFKVSEALLHKARSVQ